VSYDLILKRGRVINPAHSIDGVMDVAFTGGKLAAVGKDRKSVVYGKRGVPRVDLGGGRDRYKNTFRQAVLTSPLDHANGVVKIPDTPGLGIEVNRDAIAKWRVA
jgi:hypothetical protein